MMCLKEVCLFTVLMYNTNLQLPNARSIPSQEHDILSYMYLGGLFTGLPEKVEKSWILTNDVLKYLVEMYNKTGFRLETTQDKLNLNIHQ